MRYAHRAENERQPEVVPDNVLPKKLSIAQLRTQALFDAERLLRELAEEGSRRRVAKECQTILEHFPTKFELMRMSEEHPMLDAWMAQKLVSRADHLPVYDPDDRKSSITP